ncbi:MAG: hypothetical protein D5R97_06125 [Candidatus Syntrophonatronum acetioxidans]|uniref:Oxaloacetate decarboxylase, gamma chain n=1 Tax=Candidatus Syntrophonatronum acetioxidans TaxID=1795816 RepID=A0A424YDC6_9FIRM|nr:MAG: hypothetical protein D5R97_06125 [Candidatus Syntrophonatronum acetioxidans]
MNGLSFGFSVLVIGFTVVCITLLLLNIIFHYFGYFFEFSKKQKDMKERYPKEKFPEEIEERKITEEEREEIEEEKIPSEVIAVISSAIASYDTRPGYRLKVKKVKRERSISPWIITGRKDVINVYGRDII